MKIKFSRHAKRRARLYKLSLSAIENILKKKNLPSGKHEIIQEVPDQKFPVKIVVSVENDTMVVITNYPLKKRRKQ
ncbi:DUF4258 domain-containing protein [Thermosulfuriphilus ammonigenes]|uniref:DUF4258 domain-containing protein n=1 Tax=Thermosulfuriphilus ammonigenes TaxID=1936021 RepID=A0A6G7PVG1_9BACT|nr:DUF4258 domain-containing protein [Thermosulfuriphilus ammonigenes]MBA2848260.1 hypothetical protein [Thermosulfuriphilus ammonigenes]QIJ71577.1 DUF4258 domain-containing protein [Thermosulfuriphilus ammonigenes]